jgi:hypothetical protein
MNQLYPDQGLIRLLTRLVGTDLSFRLFNNNVTPDLSTTFASLVEETTGGYSPITVHVGDFTLSGVTSHVGTIIAPPISWVPSGATWNTYGYFVTDVSASILLAVARFDSAPITTTSGNPLLVTPKFSDFSRFAA